MIINVTPDWVISQIPEELYLRGDGIVCVSARDKLKKELIMSALDESNIPFIEFEGCGVMDLDKEGNGINLITHYEFELPALESVHPVLYRELLLEDFFQYCCYEIKWHNNKDSDFKSNWESYLVSQEKIFTDEEEVDFTDSERNPI